MESFAASLGGLMWQVSTPAYRDLLRTTPKPGRIREWAAREVLTLSAPLAREGQVVVTEDPALRERSLYFGVLGAIADGARSPKDVAVAIGRTAGSVAFPLRVLSESGWIVQHADPLHQRGTTIMLEEPMVRTRRLLIDPFEARLRRADREQALAVWDDNAHTIASRILAPHLERVAAQWMMTRADPTTTGGRPSHVAPSTIGRGAGAVQLDLVGTEPTGSGSHRVCCVGEVKSGATPMAASELDRLDAAVTRIGPRADGATRLLVSRAGFTAELRRATRGRPDVQLVDLERIYNGS